MSDPSTSPVPTNNHAAAACVATVAAAATAAAAAAAAAASPFYFTPPPSIDYDHVMHEYQQFPSAEEFNAIVNDYLQNLSSKKRDKALVDSHRYKLILQVLKDPRNTAISTAQFRFWVKKMFRLFTSEYMEFVCHDDKPVATREDIYGILILAHKEAHHGGRDKTSALVRKRYSWIPKELIARFVRHCPFCISRRNGCQLKNEPFYNTPQTQRLSYDLVNYLTKEQVDHQQQQQRPPHWGANGNNYYNSISIAANVATCAAAAAVATPQEENQFDFYYSQQPREEDSPTTAHSRPFPSLPSYSYLLYSATNNPPHSSYNNNKNTNAPCAAAAAAVVAAAAIAAVNSNEPSSSPSCSSSSAASSPSDQHQTPCAYSLVANDLIDNNDNHFIATC